jgi:hypothetical protein
MKCIVVRRRSRSKDKKGNATTHREELPQHLLEAIHKLVHAGASHEAICSVLGLRLEVVQQVLDQNTSQVAKLTESVMAPDGNYERSSLEAHPTPSAEHVTLSLKKKAKISEISMRAVYIAQEHMALQFYEDSLPSSTLQYYTDQLHRTSLVCWAETSNSSTVGRSDVC